MENKKSGEAHEISFSEEYGDFVLLDVGDAELRKAIAEPGAMLCFKGTEDIVLCTKQSTYAVYSRETSNELLLLQNAAITGSGMKRFLEPVRTKPRLGQLREILLKDAVTVDEIMEEEGTIDGKRRRRDNGFLLTDLISQVQASEEEIKQCLLEMGAFSPEKDRYRVLSRELEEQVIVQLVLEINSRGGDISKVSLDELTENLTEFPRFVREAILNKYQSENGQLNVLRLARFQAETILIRNPEIKASSFESALVDTLPSELDRKSIIVEDVTKNLAVKDEDKDLLLYLPLDALPRDARKRCDALFNRRYFWPHAELQSYLEGVDGTINEAIQKYARVSTDAKGQKGFVRR